MRFAIRLFTPALAAGLLAIAAVTPAAAHGIAQAGAYTFAIGFQHEPTFAGEVNGVQVFVSDAKEKPVTDIAAGDLSAVVGFGGQLSDTLSLEPAFDVEEGWGTPGEYEAVFIPTAPGDYTFHITGAIHGAPIDLSMTSSPSTFSSAETTTALEFPVKLPSIADLATKVDRVDARAQAAQAGLADVQAAVTQAQTAAQQAQAAGAQIQAGVDQARASSAELAAAVQSAQAAATQARDDASRALLVAIAIGVAGIVIGLIALASSMRGRRRSAAVGEQSPLTS